MKAEVLSVKREHIVEAAIRRFSHFGINKTTLGEIAMDISISKASLFYYFQDKSSLMEAVGLKIITEFIDGFEESLSTASSADDALLRLVEVKRAFFKKYLLLAVQADSMEINKLSPELAEVILQGHRKIQSMVSVCLQQGIEDNSLVAMDTNKTSRLILETLEAFEMAVKNKSNILENGDIDDLFNKQKEVVQMLVNGLKRTEWKN